ncbi:MAG: peptidoglycan D,D-transpeptidase FtsI family protein [Planctomycetota bacterium]
MTDDRTSRWRFTAGFALLAAALVALAGRVVWLQLEHGEALSASAARQQRRLIDLPAKTGSILARDRDGLVLLAGSRQVRSIYADPMLLGEENFVAAADEVGRAVGAGARKIYERLYRARFERFTYLLRDVTEAQARAVTELKLPSVRVTHEWRRRYPRGPLGAHVVGYRRMNGEGGAGVEFGADAWLRGRAGRKVIRADAARVGKYARVTSYQAARDGRGVLLTLDVAIQGYLEAAMALAAQRHDARSAMGVVMDPNTGAILAIGSVPTFDPNRFADAGYRRAHRDHVRNRAVTDPYEPGSSFKPFIAAGAVQMGRATIHSEFFCHHGLYRAHRGGTIRDFPGERFGNLPLREIVVHSSNIGMAKLGEHLGDESLHRIASAFGFGARTGVDLPGECPGTLVPTSRWTPYATRRMPFGQGPVAVTALQLATAFSAIANGGVLMRPRIVDRVFDADGGEVHRTRPQRIRRVLSRAVADEFRREVLVHVVERGTGRKCRLDRWQVFGKTGTAQIGTREGYPERAYTATFVAGAPATRPELVCVISVYWPDYAKGHTGGSVAAPAVREVLRRSLAYLAVPPDRFVTVASASGGGPAD